MTTIQSVLFKWGVDEQWAEQLLTVFLGIKKIKPFHYTDKYMRARIIKPNYQDYYYRFVHLPNNEFDLIV